MKSDELDRKIFEVENMKGERKINMTELKIN